MGSQTVIVVEGYFDCVRIHQAGLPWVVALMGSSLSLEQEKVLVERFERVILMLDGDDAGRVATQTICAKLLQKCDVLTAVVSDGAQPDQLSPGEIRELVFAANGMIHQSPTMERRMGTESRTDN